MRQVMVFLLLMLPITGCAMGPRSAPNGNPSQGAEIGADSNPRATAEIDPCLLALDNPVWRDHGGVLAYRLRCGDGAP